MEPEKQRDMYYKMFAQESTVNPKNCIISSPVTEYDNRVAASTPMMISERTDESLNER